MHWTRDRADAMLTPGVRTMADQGFRDEVVLGLQWGDEGKGKLVDERAPRCSAVVRFQGGANAGHTVVTQHGTRILHQVPCGALHPGVTCILASGCAVDPIALRMEVEGLDLAPDRLTVSPRAQVVLPWYAAIDAAEEALRGAAPVGTTRRGIGPAYAAKAGRFGITVGEYVDAVAGPQRLRALQPWTERWLAALGLSAPEGYEVEVADTARWLAPFVRDDRAAIDRARTRGPVLFEGQLGLMRDPDHGAYPFVTGASLLPPAALLQPGTRVIGVVKPYITLVGGGSLPTEAGPEDADLLRRLGGEFGATTGRPRRIGWLDLPALRYAKRCTGATHLAVQMKLDGLAALGRIPVCVRYHGVDEAAGYPQPHAWAALRPVYEDWSLDADPLALARRLAAAIDLPLLYVGTGPGRGACVEPDDAS